MDERASSNHGKIGLVGPGGQAIKTEKKRSDITDIVSLAVNMKTKELLEFTISPGIQQDPLSGAKILLEAGRALLENVSPKIKVRDRIQVATIPLKVLMERLKTLNKNGGK